VADLFEDWLRRHLPDRAERVLHAVAALRGGRLNDPRFGSRMTGEGVEADLLAQRFRVSCRRLGFERPLPPLECSRFAPPPEAGAQLSLF
jgi:DNA repair photolyase